MLGAGSMLRVGWRPEGVPVLEPVLRLGLPAGLLLGSGGVLLGLAAGLLGSRGGPMVIVLLIRRSGAASASDLPSGAPEGSSSPLREPKSSPGPTAVRCRNPAGNGIRDSRGRAASFPASGPGSGSGSIASGARGGADPDDRPGLLTAGDSAFDSPSVGDEELTHDPSRGWMADENHPDTVRLERAAAKGPARANSGKRRK